MEKSKNKSLVKSSVIYLATSILNSGLPFFLLPVLTYYLTAAEYGNLGLFQAFYTAFLALVGLGTAGAVVRNSYDLSDKELATYIFNVLVLISISLVFCAGVVYVLSDFIYELIEFKTSWLLFSLIYAYNMVLINLLLGQYQVRGLPVKYGVLQISNASLNLSLSILFVVILTMNEEGRMLGMLISSAIFSIVALIILRRSSLLRFQFSKINMQSALKFGLPLIPHELSTFLMNWVSVILVNALLDKSFAGIYLFAFQISMILGVACDAFNRAFVPWLFEKLKLGTLGAKKIVVKITYLYFAFMIIVTLLSFVILPVLIRVFFPSEYVEAVNIVGLLFLGQALGGMYLMVTNYIYYSKKTGVLSLISLSASAIGLTLMYFGIKNYGIYGAAVAFVFMKVYMFSVTWYVANKHINMPWFFSCKV